MHCPAVPLEFRSLIHAHRCALCRIPIAVPPPWELVVRFTGCAVAHIYPMPLCDTHANDDKSRTQLRERTQDGDESCVAFSVLHHNVLKQLGPRIPKRWERCANCGCLAKRRAPPFLQCPDTLALYCSPECYRCETNHTGVALRPVVRAGAQPPVCGHCTATIDGQCKTAECVAIAAKRESTFWFVYQ